MSTKTMGAGVKMMVGALALTLGLGSAALAQPRAGGHGGFRGPGRPAGPLAGLLALHPELPLSALNLTDAQREQVRTILQGHREEGRALASRAQTALEALRKASAGTVDEGAIGQQGQALGAVIADAAVLRARVRSQVFAILTPEQQAEATKIQAERQTRLQERRAKMQQRFQERREKRQKQ
jgi:Spy/CpxP family protein refolding chaperone